MASFLEESLRFDNSIEVFLSYFFYPHTHPLTSGVVGVGIYMNVSFFLALYI